MSHMYFTTGYNGASSILEKSVTRKRTAKIEEPTIENMARLQKSGMKKEAEEMFKKWVASPLCGSLQEILRSDVMCQKAT